MQCSLVSLVNTEGLFHEPLTNWVLPPQFQLKNCFYLGRDMQYILDGYISISRMCLQPSYAVFQTLRFFLIRANKKLLTTDTDSFVYEIKTEDFYEDMKGMPFERSSWYE